MTSLESSQPATRQVTFFDFTLDVTSGDLRRGQSPVRLAAQPAEVLRLLVERAGELVLRSEIQEHVWGDQVIEQDQGLNTCIRQVRTALGDRANPPRFIETVPRRGYRFIAPVRPAEPQASPIPSPGPTTRSSPPRLRRLVWISGAAALALVVILLVRSPGTTPPDTSDTASANTPVDAAAADTGELGARSADSFPSDDPMAREAYLRGRYLLTHGPHRDPQRAEVELRRALDHDPNLALAHVALADVYHAEPGEDSIERQRTALHTALGLDPSLAEAHLRLAKIRLYADWSFEAAGDSFERAYQLAPNDPETLRQYALYLAHLRRHDEAIEHIEHARHLDPVSVAIHGNGASIYFAARRYEQVVEVCERALELAPDHIDARTYLLHAYHRMGRPEPARAEAIELMRRLGATPAELLPVAEDPDPELGLRRFFEWQLDWLRARGAPPVAMAAALLPLGRVDEVFIWLEEAYRRHAGDLLLIAGDPRADAFRGDPRFVELLRQIGFPDDTIER